MADFDIPVEDFEALRAMVEARDLFAAETRLRELTKVSSRDARYFVRGMAEELGDSDPADKKKGSQIAKEDFEIPVEDFKALQTLIDAGDLSAAESRFRKLTKVSARNAQHFVQEMAAGMGDSDLADKKKGSQSAKEDFEIPVKDFKALQALIDAGDLPAAETRFRKLTKVSAKKAQHFVQEMAAGMGETEVVEEKKKEKEKPKGSKKDKRTAEADADKPVAGEPKDESSASAGASEEEPEPVYTTISLPTKDDRPPGKTDQPVAKKVPSLPKPVKPPTSDESVVQRQHDQAAEVRKSREAEVPSNAGDPRWYERVLPFLGAPMLIGGLIGVAFCGLGFLLAYSVLQTSWKSRAVRCFCAVVGLLGSYGGFVATVIAMTGAFSLLGWKEKVTKPASIEPSSTVDWISPAGSVVEGTDAELQKIFDLYYRPLDALPLVSTSIEDSTLTVVSNEVKIDSALTGLPLLDKEQDLIADFGRGNSVTLVSYALRLPSDDPGAPLSFIDPENPDGKARESSRKIPVSKHRKRPVLRCIVRLKRVSKNDVTFHLFDAQTRRKVASAKPTQTGEVDFQLGIWHRTPFIMVVEAKAWASSATGRHRLPVGEDVKLGLGRAQVAYIGPGQLHGIKNGATLECGKPYRMVNTGEGDGGGMVIVRYAPPYLANSTALLMTATKDHLVSSIPAFGNFELKPVGPDGDQLGFRMFHIRPTIDNQLFGKGLQRGKSKASQPAPPKVERLVDFSSDFVSASFDSQRGRGLIAMDEIPGMQTVLENENLFDLEVPLMVFEEADPLLLLLQFAADAVEFDLDEIEDGVVLPDFLESIEYTNLTPSKALLKFEQLSGIRVVVDSEQRRIHLQP